MQNSPGTPFEVMDYILEETRRGLFEDGYDRLRGCIAIPHEMETFDGMRRLETESEFCRFIDGVRHYYSNIGVTDLVRRCLEAEFRDPDTVLATHETRLVSGDKLLADTYPVLSEVHRIGGKWYLASAKYALTDNKMLQSALRPTG